MDQATRAAELARLSEWVTRILLPGYRLDPPLRPCWRAHLPVVWELGTVWAEWRRVYDRKAPELAGALDWHNRWLPGALERSQRALSGCSERQCILAASAAAGIPRRAVQSQLHRGPPEPDRPGVLVCLATVRYCA